MTSLTEAAKAVLEGKVLEEGLPTVGSISGGVSNPNPVDLSTVSTHNAKTLRPGSGNMEGRFANPGATPATLGYDDLGGAETFTWPDNLGTKASGKNKKDSSIKGAGTNAEPMKKLAAEEMEQDGDVVGETTTMSLAERLKALKEARKRSYMQEKECEDEDEDEDDDEEEMKGKKRSKKMDEEFELSEELEDFIAEANEAGLSEEEILDAIDENFEFIAEEEEQLDEVGNTPAGREMLKSYIKKAANSARNHAYYAGLNDRPGKEDKHYEKSYRRTKGIERAVNRLANEEYDLDDYQVDMSEHVNALLAGENLSEDFHEKATTIFEAAVKSKLEEEVALLEQAYAETLEERVNDIMEELASSVDDYLNYVVEQWIEENEVAVESALRSELTEDFISGLRSLFAEHYIDIPEEQVPVVEELSSTVEELEAKLNEEIQRNVALTSMLSESRKAELTAAVCEGLTHTQASKLKSLAEGVDYTSDEEFIEKVATLRENYFPVAVKTDGVLDRVETHDPQSLTESALEGPMAKYVAAIGKTQLI